MRVEVTNQAVEDAREYAASLREESKSAQISDRWLTGLFLLIEALSTTASSHALIPEASILGRPYRAFHFHSHRVIYRTDEASAVVYVVRILHGARRPLRTGDLKE